MKQFYVYILASKKNGTLYVGVTSDIRKRIYEHLEGLYDGFTKQHSIKRLVWYEVHDTVATAIQREKNLKDWKREWKIELIEDKNPDWNDLYSTLSF